ncbi:PREDICTED: UPF0496 protein At4g34320-like [Fragaria vesca subsp. vesca]|uniref:UPF0496 protein At4g34320-like n=1 Tax=Fragaria vesca subsp. vesca TaxID=101020 RepID=UPI0002C33211|nr:PREDICTED: UPF0496 protein At4g34320-like [Fragaria vesca subsp. vesca]
MGESYKKKHDEQLESLKDDPEVNDLANNIRTRAEAVNNICKKDGFSIACLKEVTIFVSYMNGQAASAILACKKDISISNKSFNLVVNEYLNNSEQLLDFCSALDQFVKSARDSHSYTQYVVQQFLESKMETEYCLKILEKLKNLKSSEDIHAHSAESLHQKIKALITHFEKLCRNLKQEIVKIDEEKNRVGTQKKRTSLTYKSISTITVICAGLLGADFLLDLADIVSGIVDFSDGASGITDAASCATNNSATHPQLEPIQEYISNHEKASEYAVKAGFMAAVAVPLNAGHSLAMSYYDKKQEDLDNKKNDIDTVRRESEASITELGNIKFRINQVVNEIDSLLAKTNTAVKMSDVDFLMKDMKQKLEQFMKKIDDLDAEAVKCSAETMQARDDVRNRIRQ